MSNLSQMKTDDIVNSSRFQVLQFILKRNVIL